MRPRFGDDIAERLLMLAAAVIRTAGLRMGWGWRRHVALQLIRSVTSAGANYEEARRAESRADFVHKVGVAAKELGECLYWLRLIHRVDATSIPSSLQRETDELIAILVASARTARAHL